MDITELIRDIASRAGTDCGIWVKFDGEYYEFEIENAEKDQIYLKVTELRDW